jgi:hypothetical protein
MPAIIAAMNYLFKRSGVSMPRPSFSWKAVHELTGNTRIGLTELESDRRVVLVGRAMPRYARIVGENVRKQEEV